MIKKLDNNVNNENNENTNRKFDLDIKIMFNIENNEITKEYNIMSRECIVKILFTNEL